MRTLPTMLPGDRHTDPASLQDQAHAWVLRIKSDRATPSDVQALKQWCAISAAHAAAFEHARQAWQDLGAVGQVFRARYPRAAADAAASAVRPGRRAFLATTLAATGAAAAAVVYPPFGLWPSVAELDADYRTAVGEQRHFEVGDHFNVELNTQTSLNVQAGADTDRLELLAGEAAISRERAGKVLEVVAGKGRISMDTGGIEVRCLSGSVRVTCLAGGAQLRHAAGTLALRPNQQVSYDSAGLGAATAVDPAEASSWRLGMLVFRDTRLTDAVAEINRYRPGRVVLLNEELGARRVSGKFRIARLDQAIDLIEESFGAKVRALPGGVVLLS